MKSSVLRKGILRKFSVTAVKRGFCRAVRRNRSRPAETSRICESEEAKSSFLVLTFPVTMGLISSTACTKHRQTKDVLSLSQIHQVFLKKTRTCILYCEARELIFQRSAESRCVANVSMKLESNLIYFLVFLNKFAHSVVKHVIFNKYNSMSILILQMFLFFKIKE